LSELSLDLDDDSIGLDTIFELLSLDADSEHPAASAARRGTSDARRGLMRRPSHGRALRSTQGPETMVNARPRW
jgi:hypothetical protein